MNLRNAFVLVVMLLTVLAAVLPALPDEAVLLAAGQPAPQGAPASDAVWR